MPKKAFRRAISDPSSHLKMKGIVIEKLVKDNYLVEGRHFKTLLSEDQL